MKTYKRYHKLKKILYSKRNYENKYDELFIVYILLLINYYHKSIFSSLIIQLNKN